MPEYAFTARAHGRRMGLILAQAPTAAEARRGVLSDLAEQTGTQRQHLTLTPTSLPDLATSTDQIWFTYAAFLARFKPNLRKGELAYLPTREPATLDRLAREGRLWTVAGNELPVLVSGFHFVDRLEYLECAVPHGGPGMIFVL